MTRCSLLWVVLVALIGAPHAWAHKASDSFIYVDQSEPDRQTVRIDVALRDLALVVNLDADRNRDVTGAELQAARPAITQYIDQRLTARNGAGRCRLIGQQWGLSSHSDGPYAAGAYRMDCPDGEPAQQLQYDLLFDIDPLHRGLVQLTGTEGESLAVMGPDARRLDLAAPQVSALATFGTFVYEGVFHLLIGLDHILFLLVLVLPATFGHTHAPTASQPSANGNLRSALLELIGIVTAFTVAHSMTLALAVLDIVQLPVAWVEMVIALSIAIAALNVFWPVLGKKTWKLAFGFGLIHGFGFASVLGDLTSGLSQTVVALAGFNIGVELGQLALLLVCFPILFLLGKHPLYARAAVPAMVLVVSCVSLYWAVERAGAL
ncbi:HupE/UreJ family protein [Marinobacter caseinilyticus]|uniref:HupE/UreJ family protein n=1 Tax=Marinobacter caseinilyticus TaxID=2692195 RepID=UPI00140AB7A1|nr:HupE/UreJ family protein [Marinobacter caseinilyticus]